MLLPCKELFRSDIMLRTVMLRTDRKSPSAAKRALFHTRLKSVENIAACFQNRGTLTTTVELGANVTLMRKLVTVAAGPVAGVGGAVGAAVVVGVGAEVVVGVTVVGVGTAVVVMVVQLDLVQ